MIAVWETEWSLKKQTDLGILVYHAMQCAVASIEAIHLVEANDDQPVVLDMHCSIGVSRVYGNHVGGLGDRWEYYLSGDGCEQMYKAEQDAKKGQVAFSKECFEAVQKINGISLDATMLESSNYLLDNLSGDIPPLETMTIPKIDANLSQRLQCYVPGPVQYSLEAGGNEVGGCMRTITILFIKLNGNISQYDPEKQLQSIQNVFSVIQEATNHVQGKMPQTFYV